MIPNRYHPLVNTFILYSNQTLAASKGIIHSRLEKNRHIKMKCGLVNDIVQTNNVTESLVVSF